MDTANHVDAADATIQKQRVRVGLACHVDTRDPQNLRVILAEEMEAAGYRLLAVHIRNGNVQPMSIAAVILRAMTRAVEETMDEYAE